MIQVGRVHDARIVVGGVIRVEGADVVAGLRAIDQQRGAVEGGCEARRQACHAGCACGEGPRGVGEDVGGRGLSEGSDGREGERVAGDGALHDAEGGLRVDAEGRGGVFAPDAVYVGGVVVGEEAVVEDDAVVGTHSAQGGSVVADDELVPARAVGLVLCDQGVGNGCQAILGDAGNVLGISSGIQQRHGDYRRLVLCSH